MPESCQELISSEETAELLYLTSAMTQQILDTYASSCVQQISGRYFTIYTSANRLASLAQDKLYYGIFPKLYTEMSTTALEISGITPLANQPVLNLKGQGVLIGIVDSGIDYTHPAFRTPEGNTRILKIWDQTISTGPTPQGIQYGTEYTEEDINIALRSSTPAEIVPSTDSGGHGTFLAGVTGGSENIEAEFVGAAPLARFVIVKLKPAKQFFRDFYFYRSDAPVYQENDIMLGINYLRRCALDLNLPLVIPFGLGSTLGGHDGYSALCNVIDSVSFFPNACICIPTGNEGLANQHYQGMVQEPETPDTMELSVSAGLDGIVLEIWGQNPAILSLAIRTPNGEFVPRIPARLGETEDIELIFDRSRISVYYNLVEASAGDEVIFIRIHTPSPGIWQFLIYSDLPNTSFHAYLAGRAFTSDAAYFLKPSPSTTLTDPSAAATGITVSGYHTETGAFYADCGRGFTRLGAYKPDLCAPCTNITGPNLRGGYEQRSGTCLAAAFTAGACAQFMTWAVTYKNMPLIPSNVIKTYLVRGAGRTASQMYPSPLWGYGLLNVYEAFDSLRGN